ncbi:MAG: hypothetical protein Q9183_000218 [Haloplaca sp. 2 TL-2023]
MSGLRAFVGNRGRPPSGDDVPKDPETTGRLQARLDKLGIDRSPHGMVDKSANQQTKAVPFSRQAIGERSRVPTPAFDPSRNHSDSRAAPQGPQHQKSVNLQIQRSADGRPSNYLEHNDLESHGMFDTDTEGLDDTTGISDLVNPVEPLPEPLSNPRGKQKPRFNHEDAQAAQTVWPSHNGLQNRVASPSLGHPAELDPSQDDLDDTDDPGHYDDETVDGQDPIQGRHAGGHALPIHHRRVLNQTAPESSRENFNYGTTATYDNFSRGPEHAGLSRKSSLSEEGSRAGIQQKSPIPNLDQPHKVSDHQIVQPNKAKENAGSAEPEYANLKHRSGVTQRNTKRRHDSEAQNNLDYDLKTLNSMSFERLANESFDTSPQPIELKARALTDASDLEKKLEYVYSLEGKREQVQAQRRAFFSTLPIDQHEECGDMMIDRFAQILSRFKEARQAKRALARDFEGEIARREKTVEKRKTAVVEDLERLKRAGQDVVRNK